METTFSPAAAGRARRCSPAHQRQFGDSREKAIGCGLNKAEAEAVPKMTVMPAPTCSASSSPNAATFQSIGSDEPLTYRRPHGPSTPPVSAGRGKPQPG
eukprot:SAG11_NODE_9422_length_913_cov_1.240786_2_plen_99_part_00